MPDTNKRFLMGTGEFLRTWVSFSKGTSGTEWNDFVLDCFNRFTSASEEDTGMNGGNREMLDSHDSSWKTWSDKEKYNFLSEKAYTKCITLKRRMAKEGVDANLPTGYLQRKGTKKAVRLSDADLASIWNGTA